MEDKIKEILLKDFNEILVKEFCTDWKEKRLYIELLVNSTPFSNLLDYITNLQEENEELREDNYAYHQLTKMQNQREYRSKFLKDFQKEYGKNVLPDYDEIYKRYDDYKTRIDKAIEYIGEENRGDYDNFVVAIGEDNGCPSRACEELLEILKGKSDE